MARTGRPTTFTPEIAERVCEAFAKSKSGLRRTLEEDIWLPEYGTVKTWAARHALFKTQLADAKIQQLLNMAEDIIDISDDQELEPNARRIMVDTRKWLLTKLIPKQFGDKLDVTSAGQALASSPTQVDARVQSIIMQAVQRKQAKAVYDQLDDNSLKLLE